MNIDLQSLQRLAFDASGLRSFSVAWLPVLLDAAVKGAVLLVVAGVLVLAMRKASSAARQVVWLLALAALIALPVASAALPSWGILPGWVKFECGTGVGPVSVAGISPSRDAGIVPTISATDPPPDVAMTDVRAPAVAFDGEPRVEAPPAIAPEVVPPVEPEPVATPAKPAAAPSWQAWAVPVAAAAWMVGTLLCLLPLVLGRISLWRLARRSTRIDGGSWNVLLKRAAQAVGLRRPITLLQSDDEPMPMVWGTLRAKLLLPAEAEDWTLERRWVVLLHELAHAKRRDCLAKLVAHVACSFYWFNPLCWIAFKLMQREAEAACDDLVLACTAAVSAAGAGATGETPVVRASDYAQHLLEIASGLKSGMLAGCLPRACRAGSSIAMARKSKLEGRLLAILDGNRNRRAITRIGLLVAAAIVVAVAIPLALLKAAPPPATGSTQPATKAPIESAQAALESARRELERAQELYGQHVTTQSEVEEARAAVAMAEAVLAIASAEASGDKAASQPAAEPAATSGPGTQPASAPASRDAERHLAGYDEQFASHVRSWSAEPELRADSAYAGKSVAELARIIVAEGGPSDGWESLNAFLIKTKDKPEARKALAASLLAKVDEIRAAGKWSVCLYQHWQWHALLALGDRPSVLELMEGEQLNTCCGNDALMMRVVAFGQREDAWALLRHFAKDDADGWLSCLNWCMVRLTGATTIPPVATNGKVGDAAFRRQAIKAWEDYLISQGISPPAAAASAATRPATQPASRKSVLTVEPPAYMQLPQVQSETGAGRYPVGSRLHWRLAYDRPVTDAQIELITGTGKPAIVPVKLAADGLSGTASATLEQSVSWRELHKVDGMSSTMEHLRVEAVPDRAPVVSLKAVKRTADAVVVAYAAQDDYGLTSLRLLLRIPNGREAAIPLPAPKGASSAGEYTFEFKQLAGVGAKLSEMELVLEAADNRPGQPQTTTSPGVPVYVRPSTQPTAPAGSRQASSRPATQPDESDGERIPARRVEAQRPRLATSGPTSRPSARSALAAQSSAAGPTALLHMLIYELRLPAEKVAELDAATLAKSSPQEFQKALAALGQAKLLYRIDQRVKLSGDRVTVGQEVPVVTNARKTDSGETVRTVQYAQIGAIVNVLGGITADGGVDLRLDTELSTMGRSTAAIAPGVEAPSLGKVKLAQSGVVSPGQASVAIGVDAGEGGTATVYLTRAVLSEVQSPPTTATTAAPDSQPAVSSTPAASAETGPVAPLGLLIYELHLPADKVADLDAAALAKAASPAEFQKALSAMGRAKLLYRIDQRVKLSGDRVVVSQQTPVVTASRVTVSGQAVNTVQYVDTGAAVGVSGKAAAGGKTDLRLDIELSVLGEALTTMAAGVSAPRMRKVTLTQAGAVAPDEPRVALSVEGGEGGTATAYVARTVLGKVDAMASRPATQPSSSKLEFSIAPKPSDLGKAELAIYMDWLKEGQIGRGYIEQGVWHGRPPSFFWLPISGELTNAPQSVTGEYDGRKYVLVSDKPGQRMVPGEGKDAWGLAKVYATTDNAGNPMVGFEFDDHGAELFAALTKANINNALAIVVDGKVVSAPIIRTALGKSGIITGKFTQQEVAALVAALRAGMPPAPSTGSGQTSRPATQPASTEPILEWGPPTAGLRISLEATKPIWISGEAPVFVVRVQNISPVRSNLSSLQELLKLQVDGELQAAGRGGNPITLEPQETTELTMTLRDLSLAVGDHKVRVVSEAVTAPGSTTPGLPRAPRPQVVQSNEVSITVLPVPPALLPKKPAAATTSSAPSPA